MMKRFLMKLAALLMAAALLSGGMSSAMAASFQAVVTSKSMKVYDQNEPHDALGSLPKGTKVTVEAYSGKAALITWNGRTGIAKISDMEAVKEDSDTGAAETAEKPSASELANARSMVTTKAAKVYSSPKKSSKYAKVGAGAALNVLAVSDGWARVERGGAVGYIKTKYLTDPASAQAESGDDEGVVTYDRKSVVTVASCKVYAKPSTSGSYVTLDKGEKLILLASSGNCAKVERGGIVGYVDFAKIADAPAEEESSAVSTAEITVDTPSASGVFSGSNEQITFKFLTKVAGYSVAAACGIMANIKYESGYKPTSGGDSGTSYGIAQWHLARRTRMINWCKKKGYDYTTLKGQLYFLDYELKTYYPAVRKKLLAVPNSAQGAYQAGYWFCYDFEAPTNRESRADTRGNYAKNTLWGRYAT